MIRMLTGIAFGYFIYTKDGRKTLSESIQYIKNNIKAINNTFTKTEEKDNNNGKSKIPFE